MIDPKILDKALEEIARERLHAELREWMIMSPKVVSDIYQRYNDLARKKEEKWWKRFF